MRCATATLPKDLPNFGCNASLSAFSLGVSSSLDFSPLFAAFLAAAYLLYLAYFPGLSLLPEPEGFFFLSEYFLPPSFPSSLFFLCSDSRFTEDQILGFAGTGTCVFLGLFELDTQIVEHHDVVFRYFLSYFRQLAVDGHPTHLYEFVRFTTGAKSGVAE